jgi:hypothetical protein
MHRFNLIDGRHTYEATEPKTFGPFGLKSEHVPLFFLKGTAIGSALALGLSRWINSDDPK